MKGYEIKEDLITINRDLTELDLFVRDFLDVLKKHSDYLVMSGFVSISTGRARGTEDIDILVPIMDKDKFNDIFNDLQKNGFWCYQGGVSAEVYTSIQDMNSIRFARIDEMFPNIEFIPIDETKKAQYFELKHPRKIKIKDFEFKIPQIEFEILYKEIVLSGKKDIADAKHLRTFFSGILKEEKFREYELIIRRELR